MPKHSDLVAIARIMTAKAGASFCFVEDEARAIAKAENSTVVFIFNDRVYFIVGDGPTRAYAPTKDLLPT